MSTQYYVVPDPALARQVVDELTGSGLSMDDIRLVAAASTDLGGLPKSDFADHALAAWLSDLVGIEVADEQVAKFEAAIDDGAVLLVVEVPDDRRGEVKRRVTDRHPQAFFGGEDEMVPPAV